MSNPRVSIAMCTYNGSKYIDEQVASILNQDFSDFELIIIDDHSSDDTFSRLKKWEASSPKIQLYQNEVNIGYNRNFEKCIELCKGEFISISDQDDIWMPQKTSSLLNAFQNSRVILAHGLSVRLEGDYLNLKKRSLQYHFNNNDTRRLLLFNQIMGHDTMFRKSLVPFILPIPDRMSYDWWIAAVATTHGDIVSVDEVLVHHRIHESNSFFTKDKEARGKELDLDETLQVIGSIPSLTYDKKLFLEKLLGLVKQQSQPDAGFNFRLFKYLFENRKIFFGHKRRALPIFSHLKNSIKYASMNFRGKGISY